jgi:hypothetical protein
LARQSSSLISFNASSIHVWHKKQESIWQSTDIVRQAPHLQNWAIPPLIPV